MNRAGIFVNNAIAAPMQPTVFGLTCECGQLIFSITGISLQPSLAPGMDLVAKCRCGREYSLRAQIDAELLMQATSQVPVPAPVEPSPAPVMEPEV